MRREFAGGDQDFSHLDPIVRIDVEHANRGSTAFRLDDQFGTVPTEMTLPVLPARVEQGDNCPLNTAP